MQPAAAATRKRKSNTPSHVVGEEEPHSSNKEKLNDKLMKLVKQSFTGPIEGEHLNGNAMHVMAHALLEHLHVQMETDFKENGRGDGLKEQMKDEALKAVEKKLEDMIQKSNADTKVGLMVLRGMIAAEMGGTFEDEFGMSCQLVGANTVIGENMCEAQQATDGCMFKTLRKICSIACEYERTLGGMTLIGSVRDKAQHRMKGQMKADLEKVMEAESKVGENVKLMETELETLQTKHTNLKAKLKEVYHHEEKVALKGKDMEKTIDEAMKVFCELLEEVR